MLPAQTLPDFQQYLLSGKLVPGENIPFYAYWANRYLTFSKRLKNADTAEALWLFLEGLQSRENIADWQIQEAKDAIHLYPKAPRLEKNSFQKMASGHTLRIKGEEEYGKGEKNGYFQTNYRRACLPAGRAHRVSLYPPGHLYLVRRIDQTPFYAPGLGLRACLDIPLYLNGNCRVSGLAQGASSPCGEEGPGPFRRPAGLECALVLFIFRAEVSPGRLDRDLHPGHRHHFHRPQFS
jgi:hypothetical protein